MKNTIIHIILLLIIAATFQYHFTIISKIKDEIKAKEKIEAALNDSIRIIKKKNGELEYEKKTIQTELTKEHFKNYDLSENQKQLLNEIKNKDNIIAAAKIKTQIEIKKHIDNTSYKADSGTITFNHISDSISYNILIENTKQADTTLSTTLIIDQLIIPNYQTINFSWGDKKEGYPVSFTIANSSPFISVTEMDSYIIPEIIKEEIKPNFYQKLSKSKGMKWIIFGAGTATGFLIAK